MNVPFFAKRNGTFFVNEHKINFRLIINLYFLLKFIQKIKFKN